VLAGRACFVGGCQLASEVLWELKGSRRANQVELFALFLLSRYPRRPDTKTRVNTNEPKVPEKERRKPRSAVSFMQRNLEFDQGFHAQESIIAIRSCDVHQDCLHAHLRRANVVD
jgi:hypothetical protein